MCESKYPLRLFVIAKKNGWANGIALDAYGNSEAEILLGLQTIGFTKLIYLRSEKNVRHIRSQSGFQVDSDIQS